MESGVSLSPWAVALPTDAASPLHLARELASSVGCSGSVTKGNRALVDCLRNVSVSVLVSANRKLSVSIIHMRTSVSKMALPVSKLLPENSLCDLKPFLLFLVLNHGSN